MINLGLEPSGPIIVALGQEYAGMFSNDALSPNDFYEGGGGDRRAGVANAARTVNWSAACRTWPDCPAMAPSPCSSGTPIKFRTQTTTSTARIAISTTAVMTDVSALARLKSLPNLSVFFRLFEFLAGKPQSQNAQHVALLPFRVAGNAIFFGHQRLVNLKGAVGLAFDPFRPLQQLRSQFGRQLAMQPRRQGRVGDVPSEIRERRLLQSRQTGLFVDDLLKQIHVARRHDVFQRRGHRLLDTPHPLPVAVQFTGLTGPRKLADGRQRKMPLHKARAEIHRQQSCQQHGQ